MNKPGIVNIINFIRAVEPRNPELDLIGTVAKQIELVKKHNMPATWLMQYDALINPAFVELIKSLNDNQEVGIWFEVPQPLVEHAGMKWRGRPGFAWDWHTDVGFSVGYTPLEREKLADVFMDEFKTVFGKYPASVGSWFIDAHLLGYLSDKYGITASCNCRDQYGTDGYTMWGGYFNQAYYPSRKNTFMPAQSLEQQIPVPIFRMLGSDPIYQYSANQNGNGQSVVTLEPALVDDGGGGVPEWVRWFFDMNYESPCLSFAYAQVGQENSFGWDAMKDGLTYQIEYIAGLANSGKLRIETLKESARWFKSKYELTPSSAVTALKDWKNEDRKSVWYCSRFYRVNFFWEDNSFIIRDIHLFDENYQERYLNEICTSNDATYDTLPIFDQFMWSDENQIAAIRIMITLPDGSNRILSGNDPRVTEANENLIIEWNEEDGTTVCISCEPDKLVVQVDINQPNTAWQMKIAWSKATSIPITNVENSKISYSYNGYKYELNCEDSAFTACMDKASIIIKPNKNVISLIFDDQLRY